MRKKRKVNNEIKGTFVTDAEEERGDESKKVDIDEPKKQGYLNNNYKKKEGSREEVEIEECMNDIDRELFGDDEMKILHNEEIENENDKTEDPNDELENINDLDFINFEDESNFSSESNYSKTSSNKSRDNDVKLIEEYENQKGKKRISNSTVNSVPNSTTKKGEHKKGKNNTKNVITVEDILSTKNKLLQKRVERNKLVVFMLCWMSHIKLLNEICNNKFLQGTIYSVYVQYHNEINRNNKKLQKEIEQKEEPPLYKDPVYLFLFIKNYFELIVECKNWITENIVTRNIKGSIIFRILRCIQRRKANNVILNLIFVCLCRCLNIPSRICMTLPNLKNNDEYSINIDKKFLKEYYKKYHKETYEQLYLNHSSDTIYNVVYEYTDPVEQLFIVHNTQQNNHEKLKNAKKNVKRISNTSSKSGTSSNSNDETLFKIFTECYSTSFSKWISFFFCFNLYYFNFFQISKYDDTVSTESKIFHILLPLPKNPEEIKTFKKEKRNKELQQFTFSLFMNKEKEKNEITTDQENETEEDEYENEEESKEIDSNIQIIKPNNSTMTSNKIITSEEKLEKDKKPTVTILSKNYKGKIYIQKENYFLIYDKKSKKLVRIIQCQTEKKKKEKEEEEKFGLFYFNKNKKHYTKERFSDSSIICLDNTDNEEAKNKNPLYYQLNESLFEYEKEEERINIVNSFADIYDTRSKKGNIYNEMFLLKTMNEELKKDHIQSKLKSLEPAKTKDNKIDYLSYLEYGEIMYDKYENEIKKSGSSQKYIKVLLNSHIFKYFYNLDHYNLYFSINKYNVFRDVSIRHKMKHSTKHTSKNNIVYCDVKSHIIRDHFRKITFEVNPNMYTHLEKVVDDQDDEYLFTLFITKMIPKLKSDFAKSNFYILKSMLSKTQVIFPDNPIGMFEGEYVYLKQNVYNLMRKESLEDKNYYICETELPLYYDYDENEKARVPLYASFQLKRRNKEVEQQLILEHLEINSSLIGNNEQVSKEEQEQNMVLKYDTSFDYVYNKLEKINVLRIKLFAHLKSNHIIQLNDEHVCLYNIQLKYVVRNIKGKIPYKLIYDTSYTHFKFRTNKKPAIPNKMIIKKKDLFLFLNLYVPPKKKQDEFLIQDKNKQIKNIWKVLCKSILYEQDHKDTIQRNIKYKSIFKKRTFNQEI